MTRLRIKVSETYYKLGGWWATLSGIELKSRICLGYNF